MSYINFYQAFDFEDWRELNGGEVTLKQYESVAKDFLVDTDTRQLRYIGDNERIRRRLRGEDITDTQKRRQTSEREKQESKKACAQNSAQASATSQSSSSADILDDTAIFEQSSASTNASTTTRTNSAAQYLQTGSAHREREILTVLPHFGEHVAPSLPCDNSEFGAGQVRSSSPHLLGGLDEQPVECESIEVDSHSSHKRKKDQKQTVVPWGDPNRPHQYLFRKAAASPEHLNIIYAHHERWFKHLRSQGYTKQGLYMAKPFCRYKLDGRCSGSEHHGVSYKRCSYHHDFTYLLFEITAALIKHGYSNHRSQRCHYGQEDDAPVFPELKPRLCHSWACKLKPQEDLDSKPPCAYIIDQIGCVNRAGEAKMARGGKLPDKMTLHSFRMLEEMVFRVYDRLPWEDRRQQYKETMRIVGFEGHKIDHSDLTALGHVVKK